MTNGVRVAISYVLMWAGVGFCAATAIGLIRFPDVYSRLHASTKALTAGLLLILAGVSVYEWSLPAALKLAVTAGFFFATAPLATHAIARAAYRSGVAPVAGTVDEYRSFVEGRARDAEGHRL